MWEVVCLQCEDANDWPLRAAHEYSPVKKPFWAGQILPRYGGLSDAGLVESV